MSDLARSVAVQLAETERNRRMREHEERVERAVSEIQSIIRDNHALALRLAKVARSLGAGR